MVEVEVQMITLWSQRGNNNRHLAILMHPEKSIKHSLRLPKKKRKLLESLKPSVNLEVANLRLPKLTQVISHLHGRPQLQT